MTADQFVESLEGVRRSGAGYVARCPAHEDNHASLSVADGEKGVVLKCFAGCTAAEVAAAMGVAVRDLFADSTATSRKKATKKAKPAAPPLSQDDVERMADALEADPDGWAYVTGTLKVSKRVMRSLQLGLHVARGRKFLAYPYVKDGDWTFANCRSISGEKTFFRIPAGQPTTLYHGDALEPGGVAVLVEGERDVAAALTLGAADIVHDPEDEEHPGKAVIVGMAGVGQVEMAAAALAEQSFVYLFLDNDEEGEAACAKLAAKLGTEKCVRYWIEDRKDIGDFLANPPIYEIGPEAGKVVPLGEALYRKSYATAPRTESPGSDAAGAPQSDAPDPGATSGTPPPTPGATTATGTVDLLAGLCESSTLPDVKLALEELASRAKLLTVPERAIERERAVVAVAKVRVVSSAAKLVDTFLYVAPEKTAALITGEDVELAAGPQDTGALLGDLVAAYERYIVLPEGAAVVLGVWSLHSWVLDAGFFTPRIVVTSPTKRCGKSLALDVMQMLCARPVLSANLTSAVLFRVIEAERPTLLIDEADAFVNENEELRGIINAGFRRDGVVHRCQGDSHEVRRFPCFAATAIAGIGSLPGTILDRAFTIRMSRRGRGEKVTRLDRRARAALAPLRPRLARWAQDHEDALREVEVDAPESLNDRQRDIAEPLLAIAELAGGEWPAKVREAIVALCGAAADDASDRRERLLGAVWALYGESVEFISSKDIVSRLTADDDSEWLEASRGKPLTGVWLARWLKSFGIESKRPRSTEKERPRGFFREDLHPAVLKYISGDPGKIPGPPGPMAGKACASASLSPESVTWTGPVAGPGKYPEKPNNLAGGPGGPGKTPPTRAEENIKAACEVLGGTIADVQPVRPEQPEPGVEVEVEAPKDGVDIASAEKLLVLLEEPRPAWALAEKMGRPVDVVERALHALRRGGFVKHFEAGRPPVRHWGRA